MSVESKGSPRVVMPVFPRRSQDVLDGELRDLSAQPIPVAIRAPEMDTSQDTRLDHLLRELPEAGVGPHALGRRDDGVHHGEARLRFTEHVLEHANARARVRGMA